MTGEERNARTPAVSVDELDETARVQAWRAARIQLACPILSSAEADLIAAGGHDLRAIERALDAGCAPSTALRIFA